MRVIWPCMSSEVSLRISPLRNMNFSPIKSAIACLFTSEHARAPSECVSIKSGHGQLVSRLPSPRFAATSCSRSPYMPGKSHISLVFLSINHIGWPNATPLGSCHVKQHQQVGNISRSEKNSGKESVSLSVVMSNLPLLRLPHFFFFFVLLFCVFLSGNQDPVTGIGRNFRNLRRTGYKGKKSVVVRADLLVRSTHLNWSMRR